MSPEREALSFERMREVGYRVALASVLGVVLAALLIGLAAGGTTNSAARGVVFAFGALMLGMAGLMLSLALRARRADEDWSVVAGYVVLRVGAGASAIWLALGGGAIAGWLLVAFVIGLPVWASLMRRRRGIP